MVDPKQIEVIFKPVACSKDLNMIKVAFALAGHKSDFASHRTRDRQVGFLFACDWENRKMFHFATQLTYFATEVEL